MNMKVLTYLMYLIIWLGFVIAGYFLYSGYVRDLWPERATYSMDNTTNGAADANQNEVSSAFAKNTAPIYANPSRLYSTAISLDADIIPMGVNETGQLEAPKDWAVAGWYFKSGKVGEESNILINGHYDDNYGRPAAFWDLKSIKLGDRVYLVDSFGREFSYQVNSIFYVGINDADRMERVLEAEGSSLTLITCGGLWLSSVGTYDNRLVVKALLED